MLDNIHYLYLHVYVYLYNYLPINKFHFYKRKIYYVEC